MRFWAVCCSAQIATLLKPLLHTQRGKWLRGLQRSPPRRRRQRSLAELKPNTADVLVNKSSQRIQSLIFLLKKLADAALRKMHCCIAALAIEKLGGRAQLECNAGPNLLPWISARLHRWFKPPPLGQRRILAAHHLLPVRRLFFSQEA